MSELLEIRREDGVVELTIRRPEKRNALHGPLWAALRQVAEQLATDPPRAVILTGAGGHFSAGMDLSPDNPTLAGLMPAVVARDLGAIRAFILDLKATMDAIVRVPCPVVAAIEGACAGGGLELALACDLRVASSTAFFSMPEALLGMVPDLGGTVRLTRLLGRSRATDLILTGRRIDAAEAERWGLVNRTCAQGQALKAARALTRELLASGPLATRECLRVLRATPSLSDAEALALETEAGARAVCAGELLEGVQAFMQKRPPRWT